VLSLLIPHFRKRFAAHQWILYDVTRGFGFFHNQGVIQNIYIDPALLKGGTLSEELLAPGEKMLEEMWRNYHVTAAITARVNLKLQARCMPRHF
jgi:probable DNA metabolism protein